MNNIANPLKLERALIAQGLVPSNCRLLEVVMAPMTAAIIRFEVFVTQDDLGKLAQAFADAFAAGAPDGEDQSHGPADAR